MNPSEEQRMVDVLETNAGKLEMFGHLERKINDSVGKRMQRKAKKRGFWMM